MDFILHQVVPKPLEGNFLPESIWGRETCFKARKHYLVKASSGKGKSTLIAYLSGTRSDYSGTMLLDGKDARQFSLNDWARWRREHVAIVFQDLRLFDELSVRDNIAIKQQLQTKVSNEEVLSMLEQLGIDRFVDQPVRSLSMGQQQRVALVRALVQPFQWLLLDEPFSHLDAENTLKMEALIQTYCNKNQAGIILTSLGAASSLNIDAEVLI